MIRRSTPSIFVPLADIEACPLYQWDRGAELPWWKQGTIPAGIALPLGALLLGGAWLSLFKGWYTPILGSGFLAAYAIIAMIAELRVRNALERRLESGMLCDLYLAGHSPEIIIASFFRSRLTHSIIGFAPMYILIAVIVGVTVYLGKRLAGVGFSAVLGIIAILVLVAILAIFHRKWRHGITLRVSTIQWLIGHRSFLSFVGRQLIMVPVVLLPLFTTNGIFILFFNGSFTLGMFLHLWQVRGVNKMNQEMLHQYLEAFVKGENPDAAKLVKKNVGEHYL